MKTGIMTLHYIPNYGAVLQAYALEKYIECKLKNNKNHSIIEIIDYRQDNRERLYSRKTALDYFLKNKNLKNFAVFIKTLVSSKDLYKLRKLCMTFIKNEMHLSKRYYKENLNDTNKDYDAIIVGSDQVWNPLLAIDHVYLLEFYKGEKYSYASSIGLPELPENEKEYYKEQLSSFAKISTRESVGKNIIEGISPDLKAEAVLDPTLLIHSSEWFKLAEKSKLNFADGYILVYIVKDSPYLLAAAKDISDRLGKKTIYISTPALARNKTLKNRGGRCDYSIYDWLYLFKHAGLVITNSFHGTAFSVNFQKNVYVEMNNPNMRATTRISDLVHRFGLQEQVIDGKDKIDNFNNMDYTRITQLLNVERKKSMEYLDRVLKNG
jgi:hypothetical protein